MIFFIFDRMFLYGFSNQNIIKLITSNNLKILRVDGTVAFFYFFKSVLVWWVCCDNEPFQYCYIPIQVIGKSLFVWYCSIGKWSLWKRKNGARQIRMISLEWFKSQCKVLLFSINEQMLIYRLMRAHYWFDLVLPTRPPAHTHTTVFVYV